VTPRFALVEPHYSGHGQIIGLSETYIDTEHPFLCVELLGYRPTYSVQGRPGLAYEIWWDGLWRERF
jgi:hypothetical protein